MHHTAHGVTVVTVKGGSKEVTKGGKNRDHSCGSRILGASLGGHGQEFPAEFSSEEGRRMTQKERTEPKWLTLSPSSLPKASMLS